MINFGYTVCGQVINKVRSPGQKAVDYHNRAGFGGILYQPKRSGEIHLLPDRHIKVLHLHLDPAVFYQLFEKDAAFLPGGLDTAVNAERYNYCFRGVISQQIEAILFRLLADVPPGVPPYLFYESLALELIVRQIGKNQPENGGALPLPTFRTGTGTDSCRCRAPNPGS